MITLEVIDNESTTVDKLWPYQLRVDGPTTSDTIKCMEEFLKNWEVQKYLIAHEIGKKTKKLHFQGIIFSKKELKDNCRNKIRYYFKTRMPKTNARQPVSITKARDVPNLESYCKKTENIILTNYTAKELSDIPEWKDIDRHKDAVWKYIREDSKEHNNSKFCRKLVKIYIEHDKQPPTKNMLYKYLLKTKRISAREYLGEIGIRFCEYAEENEYSSFSGMPLEPWTHSEAD